MLVSVKDEIAGSYICFGGWYDRRARQGVEVYIIQGGEPRLACE